jgi:hypothetical protein
MALTEQQIKNWRFVLLGTIGPYANIMPAEDIQRIATAMQMRADRDEEDRHTYHEDRASITVAEHRAMKAREASMKAHEDRLASLAARVTDALE